MTSGTMFLIAEQAKYMNYNSIFFYRRYVKASHSDVYRVTCLYFIQFDITINFDVTI